MHKTRQVHVMCLEKSLFEDFGIISTTYRSVYECMYWLIWYKFSALSLVLMTLNTMIRLNIFLPGHILL